MSGRIIPILADFPVPEMTRAAFRRPLGFVGPALVIAFRVQLGCYAESHKPLSGS